MKTYWFTRWCRFVERIPTIQDTTRLFWSLMYHGLTPEDRTKVVTALVDRVTDPAVNTPNTGVD